MNYLIITREFPPAQGGIGRFSRDLAAALKKRGHAVRVLTWENRDKNTSLEALDELAVTRINKPTLRIFQIGALFFRALGLSRQARLDRVLATTWNFSGVAAWLLKVCLRVPYVVFTFGSEINPRALSSLDRKWMLLALKNCDKIFASSRMTASRLRLLVSFPHALKRESANKDPRLKSCGDDGVGACGDDEKIICGDDTDNVVFLPLGVSVERFNDSKYVESVKRKFGVENKKIILTVARLVKRKGHEQVLEALPRVLKKIPETVYLIVGDGPERAHLKEFVVWKKLSSVVHFAGFVPDEELSAYYQACDVFVHPNREMTNPSDPDFGEIEGFGIALVEANAAGKPVIAGRSGGAGDAIIDGQTGLLVDPEDPEKIAEAVIQLLTDPALAKSMGEAGAKRVREELDWDVLIQKYEKAFDEVSSSRM